MSRFSAVRTCALLLAASALTACSNGSVPTTDQVPAPAQGQPASTATGAGATTRNPSDAVYVVDMDQSEIYWRIYRAGPAARFGHNHVISVAQADGRVYRAADLADSTFELNIPVASLVVDDQDIRDRYGEDFATPPSDEDIAGTHANMLSESLLDGAEYPVLALVARDLRGGADDMSMDLDIDIAGRAVTITAPVSLTEDEQRIVAEGEFRLSHGDLGLTPFSVAMGAIRVADEIDFTYRIVALRDDQ